MDAHEVIKENAVAVAEHARDSGDQDLIERLAADERLPMSQADLDAALADRHAFIGAAESQVDHVLRRVQVLVDAHPEAAHKPGVIL